MYGSLAAIHWYSKDVDYQAYEKNDYQLYTNINL